jgi:hypothetical protein
MIGVFSIPFMTVFTTMGYWLLKKELCMFWVINDFSIGTISIYSLLLVAIHRYRQIKYPVGKNENLTKLRMTIIVAKWLLVYLFWGLSVVLIVDENFVAESCYFTYTFAYVFAANSVGYMLPIFVVFIMNSIIFYQLRKKADHVKKSLNTGRSFGNSLSKITSVEMTVFNFTTGNQSSANVIRQTSKIDKESKALLCLTVMTLVLFGLFSIFCVTWPLKAYCSQCVSDLLLEIGYWNSYIYSSINPIILFVFHNKFRAKFVQISRKLFCFFVH